MAPLVPRIERSLGPEVLANRVRRRGTGWALADWRRARAAWTWAIADATRTATPGEAFALADVRDCYPSIGATTVSRGLGSAADAVVALLQRLDDAGVRGLPVGPDPSAVLANAVLAPLDDALRAVGVRHRRWVDDVVLWGSPAGIVRAFDALHRAAGLLGLELHPTKTRVLAGPEELGSVGSDALDRSGITDATVWPEPTGGAARIIAAP